MFRRFSPLADRLLFISAERTEKEGKTPMDEYKVEAIGTVMTEHAQIRMFSRRLSERAIQVALAHGREVHTRGAVLYAIGKKEVAKARRTGSDISRYEGVHVVCTSDGCVLTVYRNHNLRGLRPTSRTRSYRYQLNNEQNRRSLARAA